MEEVKTNLLLNEKKPSKFLWAKILIIVVAVLGLSLITLSFIPVKYIIDIHLDNATKITLYQSGNTSSEIYKSINEEDFNKIVKTFNTSYSKDLFANAFFTGNLNNSEKIEYNNNQSGIINSIAKNSSSKSKYILFSYDEEQQIMVNGKEYTKSEPDSASKFFKQVLIEINDASTLTQSTIYYLNSNNNSNFKVTFYTTGSTLFDLIGEYFN